jgi:hypothetical protein
MKRIYTRCRERGIYTQAYDSVEGQSIWWAFDCMWWCRRVVWRMGGSRTAPCSSLWYLYLYIYISIYLYVYICLSLTKYIYTHIYEYISVWLRCVWLCVLQASGWKNGRLTYSPLLFTVPEFVEPESGQAFQGTRDLCMIIVWDYCLWFSIIISLWVRLFFAPCFIPFLNGLIDELMNRWVCLCMGCRGHEQAGPHRSQGQTHTHTLHLTHQTIIMHVSPCSICMIHTHLPLEHIFVIMLIHSSHSFCSFMRFIHNAFLPFFTFLFRFPVCVWCRCMRQTSASTPPPTCPPSSHHNRWR